MGESYCTNAEIRSVESSTNAEFEAAELNANARFEKLHPRIREQLAMTPFSTFQQNRASLAVGHKQQAAVADGQAVRVAGEGVAEP